MANKDKCDLCSGSACKCEKEIKVSFCPKCKSTDVKYTFGLWNLFGAIPKMKCGKCGNEMPSFPLLVTSKKLLAESAARKGVPSKKGTAPSIPLRGKVPSSSGKKKAKSVRKKK